MIKSLLKFRDVESNDHIAFGNDQKALAEVINTYASDLLSKALSQSLNKHLFDGFEVLQATKITDSDIGKYFYHNHKAMSMQVETQADCKFNTKNALQFDEDLHFVKSLLDDNLQTLSEDLKYEIVWQFIRLADSVLDKYKSQIDKIILSHIGDFSNLLDTQSKTNITHKYEIVIDLDFESLRVSVSKESVFVEFISDWSLFYAR